MKLKIDDSSQITASITIRGTDTWEVDVRYLTMRDRRELQKKIHTNELDPVSGAYVPTFNDELWAYHASRAYVRGWRGLTPSILATLVAVKDRPETEEIPYDEEIAEQLWTEIPPSLFSEQVVKGSQRVLAMRELQKKTNSTNSSD